MSRDRPLALWERLAMAGAANSCGATVTNPIDVVKVRLQLAGRDTRTSLQDRRSFVFWLSTIVRNEGVRGLYKGVAPAIMREMSYSAIRMGLYEPFKELLGGHDVSSTPFWIKIAAGAMSGTLGSAVANPTDLVKIRVQADPSGSTTVVGAFRHILSHEGGVRGLWQGLGPTMQRAAVLTATQVPVYDEFKRQALSRGWFREGVGLHFVASVIAGLASALTTSPIDVVKTRIMNQRASAASGQLYRGVIHAASQIMRTEGPLAFYKGFFPNWYRIAPHTTVSLIVFEAMRAHVGAAAI